MQYSESLCFLCKHIKGSRYDEQRDESTYYCKAYSQGIPEAVFHAGHLYPKPGDNGIQFEQMSGALTPEDVGRNHSQEEEDADYRGYQEYYEEVEMSDFEFAEKMKREHGDDWYLYQKPERIDD